MPVEDFLLLVVAAYTVSYAVVVALSSPIVSALCIIRWRCKKDLVKAFTLPWRLLGASALCRLRSLSKPSSILSMS